MDMFLSNLVATQVNISEVFEKIKIQAREGTKIHTVPISVTELPSYKNYSTCHETVLLEHPKEGN